jgi:hypothetical protein
LSTNPGGSSARMVTEESPSLFAHGTVQPFRALDGYPYPLFLFRGHTAAHRGGHGLIAHSNPQGLSSGTVLRVPFR